MYKTWLDEALRQSMLSEYEDEDVSPEQVYSRLDEHRLSAIKQLFFNILRDKIGQNKMKISSMT